MPKYARLKPCKKKYYNSSIGDFAREYNFYIEKDITSGKTLICYDDPNYPLYIKFRPMGELAKLYNKKDFIIKERE